MSNPGLIVFIAFILLRIFRVIAAAQKRKSANNAGMDDLSGRSMPQAPWSRGERRNINQMNPMNRRQTGSANPLGGARVVRPKHKRDREDPFDGLNGDVTQAKLTMDDIVTK